METLTIEESKLKMILKSALIELLEERRDLLTEAVEEALEDLGLFHAIKEGETSGNVARAEVFKKLGA